MEIALLEGGAERVSMLLHCDPVHHLVGEVLDVLTLARGARAADAACGRQRPGFSADPTNVAAGLAKEVREVAAPSTIDELPTGEEDRPREMDEDLRWRLVNCANDRIITIVSQPVQALHDLERVLQQHTPWCEHAGPDATACKR